MNLFRVIFIFLLLLSCQNKMDMPNDVVAINRKAEWINAAFQNIIQQDFPRIKAVSWWQEKWENEDGTISDIRINSSQQALEAFRSGISNPVFLSRLNFQQQKLVSSSQGIYFGAFPDFGGPEDNVSEQRIADFENLAQKPIAWAYFSDNWYQDISFPLASVQSIHQAGKVPFVRMMSRSIIQQGEPDPVYSMQRIIDGDFDNDLLQWFQEASQVGFPFLIEFGTEVNGDWFPWNGVHNGGAIATNYGDPNLPDGPERFRDAYRHIIDLSRQAGAHNLTWFFHVDCYGLPEDTWNDFENYYPGDTYIDWIGVSAYGAVTPDEEVESFAGKMNRIYTRLTTMTNKPMAVLEFGIVEDVKP